MLCSSANYYLSKEANRQTRIRLVYKGRQGGTLGVVLDTDKAKFYPRQQLRFPLNQANYLMLGVYIYMMVFWQQLHGFA